MKAALGTLAALVLVASGASSAAAQSITASFIELRGSHGYAIQAGEIQKGDRQPTASISARRQQSLAIYEVPAELARGKAEFGSLGSFDLHFHMRRRSIDRPAKGCTWITEKGIFRGGFSFHGEGDYTSAEATSIPGKVLRLPHGFCGFGGDRAARPKPSFLFSSRLAARTGIANGYLQFEAASEGAKGGAGFEARIHERIGAMTISRSVSAHGKDALSLDPGPSGSRTADITPPAPFKGSARFEDTASAPASWTGTLAVPLPGAGTVALTGPGFTTKVCPRVWILNTCQVPPRPFD